MGNEIIDQIHQFFIYLISGILIGILFDIFRVLRKTFKTSDFITYIEDILFWIITGFFLIFLLITFSKGEIRFYLIMSLILGISCYILFISKFFIKINVKIITCIKNLIYRIIKLIIIPVKVFVKLLIKIFSPITFFVINLIKKIKKIVFKRRILKSNVEK